MYDELSNRRNIVVVVDEAHRTQDGFAAKTTVRIFYESRLAKIALSEEGKKLIAELDQELAQEDLTESQQALIGQSRWQQELTYADILKGF